MVRNVEGLTKGIFCMGLTGYEVFVCEDGDHVYYKFSAPDAKEEKIRRAQIYYNTQGEPYFNADRRRIYLNQVLRV